MNKKGLHFDAFEFKSEQVRTSAQLRAQRKGF
jgi:hypothetical protein